MSDETSMSVATASKHARENHNDATQAIRTLFNYVGGGEGESRNAAAALTLAAKRAPETLDGQTDRFENALKTADDPHARRDLGEAINRLIEQQAIPIQDAGPALTEATRIRDDEYWESNPENELMVIQEGLEGWTEIAAIDRIVPEIVVKRAIGLIDIADANTLLRIIHLLQSAIESGNPEEDTAFEALIELAGVEQPTIISEATLAIAELVLSGEITDEDAAREVITSNNDAVRRDTHIVEQAQDKLS